jgi:hypothetical protein
LRIRVLMVSESSMGITCDFRERPSYHRHGTRVNQAPTHVSGLVPITRVIGGICHLKNPQAPDVDTSPWVEGLAQISWKLS